MNPWFNEFAKRCAEVAARHQLVVDGPVLEADVAREVLELTRVVAHTAERQFAPLAAFVAGRTLERMFQSNPDLTAEQAAAFLKDLWQSFG